MSEAEPFARRNIIVIGASAGGVEALIRLVDHLPPRVEAAFFVILHLPLVGKSHLPQILSRHTKLKVSVAVEGEAIEPNRIYVAPPNRHLVIERDCVHLITSPKVNGFRPSIDVTFASAARAYGCQVIGVVLSGALDDGAAGLAAIHRAGGVSIVQDPEDALYASMPLSALQQVDVDYTLPAGEIPNQLVDQVQEPLVESSPEANRSGEVVGEIDQDINSFEAGTQLNSQSVLTCPDCGGVLWVADSDGIEQYICHTGHRYSRESLLDGQSQALEQALRMAIRALRERAFFCARLASRAREHGHLNLEKRFLSLKSEAEENAKTIDDLFSRPGTVDVEDSLLEGDDIGPS